MTVMIEAFISFICLATLIVILIEAQAAGGSAGDGPSPSGREA